MTGEAQARSDEAARALQLAVDSIGDDDAVEIAGVRIERCDEYGSTTTTRDLTQARLDLEAAQDIVAALRVELQQARDENERSAHAVELWKAETIKVDDRLQAALGRCRDAEKQANAAEFALADARRALDEVRAIVKDWADEDASPDADRVKLVTLPTRIWAIVAPVSGSRVGRDDGGRNA